MASQCSLCGFGAPASALRDLRGVGPVCGNCERAYRAGRRQEVLSEKHAGGSKVSRGLKAFVKYWVRGGMLG